MRRLACQGFCFSPHRTVSRYRLPSVTACRGGRAFRTAFLHLSSPERRGAMRRTPSRAFASGALAVGTLLGLPAPAAIAQAPTSYYYPAPAPAGARPAPGYYYYPAPAASRPLAGYYYYPAQA